MAVRIRDTSRLKFARLITVGGVEHWESPEYPEVGNAADDLLYEVQAGDRIDLLSNRFYQTPDLWWIIALANEFRLLPNDLNTRDMIRIPSARRVFSQILRRPSRGLEGR